MAVTSSVLPSQASLVGASAGDLGWFVELASGFRSGNSAMSAVSANRSGFLVYLDLSRLVTFMQSPLLT